MAIHEITKEAFYGFGPAVNPALSLLAIEQAWFRNTESTVLGAVLFDKTDKDWNFVVLGRDERGKFRWIGGESSFESRPLAEESLQEKMLEFEKSGDKVFPQGD